jgi:hypothetical protein
MDQLLVQVEEGGPRPCGVEGESSVESVEMVGSCWLLWGAPLSRRAHPYCLLDWQGDQAPSGGLVISSSSLMQLRVDEK